MIISSSHPLIHYAGHEGMREGLPRPVTGSPYSTDTPSGRISFICDAAELDILLDYADKAALPGHNSYSSTGIVLVDGRQQAVFSRQSDTGGRQVIHLALPGCCCCEIVFPIADTVFFRGLEADELINLYPVEKDSRPVYVSYGDSLTQGFYAGDALHSYPSLLAALKGWDIINMGFGSRAATLYDAKAVVAQQPGIVSVLIGANDCLGRVALESFGETYTGFIGNIRQCCPGIPIIVITPLCVPFLPGVSPDDFRAFLREHIEKYRQIIRKVIGTIDDEQLLLIEGTGLIPEDLAYFADDGLHPNDAGFKIMAERLSGILTEAGI